MLQSLRFGLERFTRTTEYERGEFSPLTKEGTHVLTISEHNLQDYAVILVGMKQQDPQQLAQYSDTYIAFVGDILHVKAAGRTLAELHNKLKEKNITQATITYIPPVDKTLTLSIPSFACYTNLIPSLD
jgi:hypothetical protein